MNQQPAWGANIKDPWSFVIHFVSLIGAIAGCVLLVYQTPDQTMMRTSGVIYGLTLIFLFLTSSGYHYFRVDPRTELYLRKLDHSAIFLFIAGSYTPVCLFKLTGDTQFFILVSIWSLATLGVLFKVFIFKTPRWLSTTIYVLMGWLVVFAIKPLLTSLTSEGVFWLFMGGACYTLGAIVYATKRFDFKPGVFGFHEVWHIFVTAGCASHFVLISQYVLKI